MKLKKILVFFLIFSFFSYGVFIPDTVAKYQRSSSERKKFLKLTGYHRGRKGYVVDHIKALKHGGADKWWNMQWQTIEASKAKDKWE